MNSSNYYKVFEQLKELSNIIKENFGIFQLEESKEEIYKYNKMVGKYCGLNYWTIPMTLSADECQELYKLYENNSSRKKLDELFSTHLLKYKSQNLKIEKNNFLNISKDIYIGMVLYTKGNYITEYPHRIYKNICSKATFQSAIKELVKYDFIENVGITTGNNDYFSLDDDFVKNMT